MTVDSIEQKVAEEYFRCTLPYGTKDSKERYAYEAEYQRLNDEFEKSCNFWMLHQGVPTMYRKKLMEKAYENGHAHGHSSVFNCLRDLCEIFDV